MAYPFTNFYKNRYKFSICIYFIISYLGTGFTTELNFSHIINNSEFPNLLTRAIVQDKQGFLILGTDNGLMRYDGYRFNKVQLVDKNNKSLQLHSIKKLFFDNQETLWIGTRGEGLYRHIKGKTTRIELPNSDYISDIISDKNGRLWIGTSNGLNCIFPHNEIKTYSIDNENNMFITSLLMVNLNEIMIGTKNGVYKFFVTNKSFEKNPIINHGNKTGNIVYALHKDNTGNIWLGGQKGLFWKASKANNFQKYHHQEINAQIVSINSTHKNLWFGSISNGLYRKSKLTGKITNFINKPNRPNSISDNTILTIYNDLSSVMWLSTFNSGIDKVDEDAILYGLESSSDMSIYCAEGTVFRSFAQDSFDNIWMVNNKSIIKYNESSCKKYTLKKRKERIKFLDITSDRKIWVSTSLGLYVIDNSSDELNPAINTDNNLNINFTISNSINTLLLGTTRGLYQYNKNKKAITYLPITPYSKQPVIFYSSLQLSESTILFATSIGIVALKDSKLSVYQDLQSQIEEGDVYSVALYYSEEKTYILVGTNKNGLYVFNQSNKLIFKESKFGTLKTHSINSILIGSEKYIWLGSDNGLIQLNLQTKAFHVFKKTDGLQGDYFIVNAAYKAPDGKLYFGGRNGFNSFYPEDIKLNTTPPNIVLTDFTRFGQAVEIGVEKDGFLLENDINQLDELTLGHKDYVVGFEFAALDYADPSRNKYAYMMEGLDPDWIYTNADNRRISYSNLKSGKYTFRVKGSNKDGIWNEVGKSLKIVVKPAPWFSWWAYVLYLLTAYCLIAWYFKKKNAENQRLTAMLKVEVARQTKELQVQKQTVEDLLIKKNELFANISHEFRTPLTLILGPINKLLKSNLPHSDINTLKMVNRNANRLLSMIEQLLQLAKISDNTTIQFYPVETQAHIASIVESFMSLANDKSINLNISNNDIAGIKISADALEIILGNLLSNAIKYTQQGGTVTVSSTLVQDKVQIAVTDTGCGLDEQQQKDIFKRFQRLDSHQNIEGIGIGLSVVEEILKINNATIKITSKPGEGSTFTVIFASIAMDFVEANNRDEILLIKQLAKENTHVSTVTNLTQQAKSSNKATVLIIEDNHDMRSHIAATINDYYHCLLAENGKTGIATAIEHIPDIIICDVMMPEMDGFHVSRVLRADTRTSHIPLMLLTALDDRESRIRGWREHVDVYLTKPFDAQELLLQLENILVIRNILKQQAGARIKAGSNTDLPKRDQLFVDKLQQLIIKKYQNPNYLRPQIASDMAVSERQLQRKLKALIDKNPMDLLREYRLQQAAIMLKDGYQVAIASDACGFGSPTHFSKCFKSQFGLSPKVYQQTCKD